MLLKVENLEQNQNVHYDHSSITSEFVAPSIIESDSEANIELENSEIDNEGTENREDTKETIDVLYIGDSIIRWLEIEDIHPSHNSKKVCIPGAKICDIRTALQDLLQEYDFKNIYLHVGSNEIPENSPFCVAQDLSMFMAEVRLYLPTTKVFLSAILPKLDDNYLPGINEINNLLCNSCNAFGYVFVQHPSFAKQGRINWSFFAWDSVHLNRRGVHQLTTDIRRLAASFS